LKLPDVSLAEIKENQNGIPRFKGVVLKDGTRLPFLTGGGLCGYTDDTKKEAYELTSFDRVIDRNQVAALLLIPEGTTEIVEIPLE